MQKVNGGLEMVPGFEFAAIECGIRYENRLDYSLIASRTPCVAAGVFTINKVSAAPVKLCRERINNTIHAILINSTNANACTGDEGHKNTVMLTGDIAACLGVSADSVLMASTGIIGRQLPFDKMKKSHRKMIDALSSANGASIPKAIMTTDTVPKCACYSFTASLGEFYLAGTAKGSGMIAPNMATLLSFLITDAPIPRKELNDIFRRAVDNTLNAISIDGDMSTNDTAVILSPLDGDPLTSAADLSAFEEALTALLSELAEMLVADGEGTTKVVTVNVINAKNDTDAKKIAKAVSESLLVKTALFGNDPNWGRVAAAAGYSGAALEEKSLSIFFDDLKLLEKGMPLNVDGNLLKQVIENKKFTITVDLGLGSGASKMLTTDLSFDYVKINAEYST